MRLFALPPARRLGLVSFAIAALTSTGALAAPAPTSTAPTSTAPIVTAPATTATVKLKLDKVIELYDSRGKLETSYGSIIKATKGKDEWREGVILLLAGDKARAAGDAVAYKKLALEANSRFDMAKTLAAGGTGTTGGLTTLKADALLGKYVSPAETAVVPTATLTGTTDTWSKQGFEPETM